MHADDPEDQHAHQLVHGGDDHQQCSDGPQVQHTGMRHPCAKEGATEGSLEAVRRGVVRDLFRGDALPQQRGKATEQTSQNELI
jgi:hypothetical protein